MNKARIEVLVFSNEMALMQTDNVLDLSELKEVGH